MGVHAGIDEHGNLLVNPVQLGALHVHALGGLLEEIIQHLECREWTEDEA